MNSKQLAKRAEVISRRVRREAQQQTKLNTPNKPRTARQKYHQNKDDGSLLILALGYLLTKRWFWYTIATLFAIGLFVRMLNPGSI